MTATVLAAAVLGGCGGGSGETSQGSGGSQSFAATPAPAAPAVVTPPSSTPTPPPPGPGLSFPAQAGPEPVYVPPTVLPTDPGPGGDDPGEQYEQEQPTPVLDAPRPSKPVAAPEPVSSVLTGLGLAAAALHVTRRRRAG